MRQIIMEYLRRMKLAEFEFVEAENGADELTKFEASSPDLILTDWWMPKMSGIEFVRQIRSSMKNDHIPIVMITVERRMGRMMEAVDRTGVNAYITKPFTLEMLKSQLTRLIDNIARHREKAAKPSGGFLSRWLGQDE